MEVKSQRAVSWEYNLLINVKLKIKICNANIKWEPYPTETTRNLQKAIIPEAKIDELVAENIQIQI